MKQVFVTGAFGFIGRHLVKRLCQEGCAVRALMRDQAGRVDRMDGVEVVVGDVRDQQMMKAAAVGCDIVFHLAGKVHAVADSPRDEAVYRVVNVEGTRNVLEGAAAGGARRFVYFSSVKVMSEGAAQCLDESSDLSPMTAYGRSKLAAEQLVLDYGKRAGLHVTCLRLPLVYGPGGKGNLDRMIAAIDRGIFPPLPELGNRRSVVHVSNVVQAALLAATSPSANGRCYFVTDARAYSTAELYELICRALGKPVPQWRVPLWVLRAAAQCGDVVEMLTQRSGSFSTTTLNKLIGSAWYSSEAIARDLGYCPIYSFAETVPQMIASYRQACR